MYIIICYRRSNLSKAAQHHSHGAAHLWPTLAGSTRSKKLYKYSVFGLKAPKKAPRIDPKTLTRNWLENSHPKPPKTNTNTENLEKYSENGRK